MHVKIHVGAVDSVDTLYSLAGWLPRGDRFAQVRSFPASFGSVARARAAFGALSYRCDTKWVGRYCVQ